LRWDYAVKPAATEVRNDRTHVKEARKALSHDEAVRLLAGDDPRPLLVLRECSRCNKTDDALLQPGADNEKVLFLARWFHCVRLPIDVVEEDHPFNALFPNNDAEHLFVLSLHGNGKQPLESDTSRTQLCAAMADALGASYEKDPTPLYKELHRYGDELDALDGEVRELKSARNKLMEARIPDRKKLAKVEAELASVQKKVSEKVAEIEKATKIALKPLPKAEAKQG
jgi:hypothetical protein